MSKDIRQPGGQPSGGEFASHNRAEAKPDLLALIGEGSEWVNGGQGEGVQVVESPVSDRDRNYWLNFDDGGYINVNPQEFGISDPDYPASNRADGDRLYIGTQADGDDVLDVQFVYAANSEYLGSVIADLGSSELELIEDKIIGDLAREFGDSVKIEFSSGGERWDDVSILWNTSELANRDHVDGKLSVCTSNIMATLEDNVDYRRVRNGAGDDIIYAALAEFGVDA